ncbi:MAG: BamA/TamA family outer membrane protein [Gemmatimonadales bacterium]
MVALLLVGGPVVANGLHAQTRAASEPRPDTVVTPGAHYAASGIHRWLLGDHYRDLWTTPVRVPVLDLHQFAGGLRPTERGGGKQTRSLRFKGADGREYAFRSLDKDPSPLLPESLRHTVAQRLFQDQISAGHPAAPLVVGPILEAAGVVHAEPRLVLMPDDPALGEFRPEFAGMLGLIEERPTAKGPGFAGADKIISTEDLFERLDKHQGERIDERAFLTARLVDLLLGDWDRHQDQWRWARLGDSHDLPWTPIPRDRDQAFARFDGLLLSLARLSAPQLVAFSPGYPSIVGLTWNARVLDRRLLGGLAWTTWDSIATALRSRVTDAVIDDAVARLPAEFRSRNAAPLAAALRSRRDHLADEARRFYRLLAAEAQLYGSDGAERVRATKGADGSLDLAVYSAGPTDGTPLIERRFVRADTREVRLYLRGGNDTVQVEGNGGGTPLLRVIGGDGDDRVVDSSNGGRVRFYDARGRNEVAGVHRVPVDARPYADFRLSDSTPYPPRDWGGFYRFRPWMSSGPEVGFFVGGGVVRYNYGFRKHPWASRLSARAGYATGADRFRVELQGDFHRVNSNLRTSLLLRASGIEVLRFFGFGNETPRIDNDAFYRVRQEQYVVAPSLVLPVGAAGSLAFGPVLKYADTDLEADRFIGLTRPYGVGGFGELGATATAAWDTRDVAAAPRRGVRLEAGGGFYPAVWDVDSTFGELHGEASTYLTPRSTFGPTLALRAGAKKVWGAFPFFESAFLGGADNVRGLRTQRFAGDAAVYGNAELRARLGRFFVILPGEFGVFALGDVGRVYLDGESSDTWHTGVGGGLWFAYLDPANTISVAVARGDHRTALYIRAGFAY